MISHKLSNLGDEALKIMVTGAGGLIGSYITTYLRSCNYNIIAIYNQNSVKDCSDPCLKIDLSKGNSYGIFEKLIPIDMIIHCAAVIPTTFHGKSVKEVSEINYSIDKNIIDFCEKKSIRLIYMSSSSIYGLDHQEIKHESSVIYPSGLYAEGKYQGEEKILKSCIPNPVLLRISSPYGTTQYNQTVFKLFLERALKNQDIFYHGSGTREQDFINVLDIAIAVEEIIKNPQVNGVFNMASGRSITMKELAELIVKTTGSRSCIKKSNQQDIQEGYKVNIDITKIQTVLKWNSQVTLEQGIMTWAEVLRGRL